MTNEEIFLAQWSTLEEEIIGMVNSEMNTSGTVDYAHLSDIFQSKLKRWSSRSTSEGRWMKSLDDNPAVPEVRAALAKLSLNEVKIEKTGNAAALLCAGCGVALGVALGGIFHAPVIVKLVATGAGAAGGLAIAGKMNKGRNSDIAEKLSAEYRKQLRQAGASVAEIWKKYG